MRILSLAGAILVAAPIVRAEPPLAAIASFSILGDMVREIGGDRVRVTTLVGPDGDAHVYQPTPADARAVAAASIVFVNGLGYEGWIDRLVKASAFKGPVVVASKSVTPLRAAEEAHEDEYGHAGERDLHARHEHGAIDPHAWQSLGNGALYVETIRDALITLDPPGANSYRANADRYLTQIRALDRQVRDALAGLPPERRRIVTSHDAFAYFAAAYGLQILSPEGVSTEAEASAKDVARLIKQIRADRIPAVFIENVTDPRLIEQIRRETGAVVGGTLYSDALSPPDGAAPTYLQMFRHNLQTLSRALSS